MMLEACKVERESFKCTILAVGDEADQHVHSLLLEEQLEDFVHQRSRLLHLLISLQQAEARQPGLKLRVHLLVGQII